MGKLYGFKDIDPEKKSVFSPTFGALCSVCLFHPFRLGYIMDLFKICSLKKDDKQREN